MAHDYDVIIVGGGLGGAALGKSLAKNGIRVLVLERETAFRDRVRGEYVHPWGVAEARALGLYELLKQTCGYEARFRVNRIVGACPQPRRATWWRPRRTRSGRSALLPPRDAGSGAGAAVQAGASVQRGVAAVEALPGPAG